jgi:hypothetical protein
MTNVMVFIIGSIFGVAGAMLSLAKDVAGAKEHNAALKEQIEQLRRDAMREGTGRVESSDQAANTSRPEGLLIIIKAQQQSHVKESYGEYTGQCFTDNDLRQFIDDKISDQIVEQLRHDNEFLEVVLGIKAMKPSDRQTLLAAAIKTARPTWAQLGKISREGQSDAGYRAEKMIAAAVVNLVQNLSKLSVEEITKRFT